MLKSSFLQIPPAVYTVPAEIEKHLNVTVKTTEKIVFKPANETGS